MLDLIYDAFISIRDFLYRCLLTIADIFKDIFAFCFEALMDLVILAISGLSSLFQGLNVTQYFSALPPEVIYFSNLCSLGTCMGMIISAITIRLLLQLIPFTRLGS